MLDVEATFCYLGDMLCFGGGCDSAIAARCCMAWGKLRKLLPVLTTRHLSPRIHGKVYEVCVHLAMLLGSETWGPEEPQWPCHDTLDLWLQRPRQTSPQLHYYRNLAEDITSVLRCQWLRWYGHIQRAMSCIKYITNCQFHGPRKKGRPQKTWSDCVKTDVELCGLAAVEVKKKRWTRQTFLMARAKCLMGDFTNLHRMYKAHQTNA